MGGHFFGFLFCFVFYRKRLSFGMALRGQIKVLEVFRGLTKKKEKNESGRGHNFRGNTPLKVVLNLAVFVDKSQYALDFNLVLNPNVYFTCSFPLNNRKIGRKKQDSSENGTKGKKKIIV